MDQRTVLLLLQEMKGVGWKSVLKLAAGFDSLAEVPGVSPAELTALGIVPQKAEEIVRRLNEAAREGAEKLEERYQEKGIRALTIFDAEYPQLLRETAQPPWSLYCIGRTELMSRPCLAVVGTRTPTVYGKKAAEDVGRFLSKAGCCVVSGMARGVDGAAHTGALQGEGGTIAVLGGGPDMVYPPEHKGLYADIARYGLILSEFPPGTAAVPGLFPLRNRIIAGLSLGTVVVEAALRSGSLITADQALDESRDVFAVPGPMTSPKSMGTNALIRQGAKIVTEPADILAEYRHIPGVREENFESETPPEMTCEEREVLRHLSHEPVSVERLLVETGTNFGQLHKILLSLCLKKIIKAVPGAAYVKQ